MEVSPVPEESLASLANLVSPAVSQIRDLQGPPDQVVTPDCLDHLETEEERDPMDCLEHLYVQNHVAS